MKISAVTPTGDRPEAFSLCLKWMSRQTVQPTEWIVSDDGLNQTVFSGPPFLKYFRRERKENEPPQTLLIQLRFLLEKVSGDYVFVIEDDDWYAPDYIETALKRLQQYKLVGLAKNQYYFLKDREYVQHQNLHHSSLCSTAFSAEIIKKVSALSVGDYPYVDLKIWRTLNCSKMVFQDERVLVLGMKQLPGRCGYTYTSNRDGRLSSASLKKDPDFTYLRKTVGREDAAVYEMLCHNSCKQSGIV